MAGAAQSIGFASRRSGCPACGETGAASWLQAAQEAGERGLCDRWRNCSAAAGSVPRTVPPSAKGTGSDCAVTGRRPSPSPRPEATLGSADPLRKRILGSPSGSLCGGRRGGVQRPVRWGLCTQPPMNAVAASAVTAVRRGGVAGSGEQGGIARARGCGARRDGVGPQVGLEHRGCQGTCSLLRRTKHRMAVKDTRPSRLPAVLLGVPGALPIGNIARRAQVLF